MFGNKFIKKTLIKLLQEQQQEQLQRKLEMESFLIQSRLDNIGI
jgi:hypothetical protein